MTEENKTVRLVIELPPEVKKDFKIETTRAGQSMQSVAEGLIRQWLIDNTTK